jgi:hypothetical protein
VSSFDTPSAVIGLELDGRGFDSVNSKLNQQAQGWERIEQTVGRIGTHMDSIIGKVGGLAAGVGLGAILADFTHLQDVASRAALTAGAVGGRNTYKGYGSALRQAGIDTSMSAVDLGNSAQAIINQVGAGGMNTPGAWGTLARTLGNYSRATGIDLSTLSGQSGQLELFQKLGAGSTGGLLGSIFAQASAAGQTGSTAQWVAAIAAATGAVGSAHPRMTGPGTSQSLGALYGAVSGANPVFRDPGMFTQGVMGVDSALAGAYQNPRMQAALQMAGVGYWEQRGGLSGPRGADMARKVLTYSRRAYGSGTIEQDLFLRSQFGDVSADMLEAFGKGKVTYDQLQGAHDSPDVQAQIHARSRGNQDTPSSRATKLGQHATGAVDGPLGWLLDHLQPDSIPGLIGTIAAYKGGRLVLSKAGRSLFRRLKVRGGAAAAEAAAGEAAGGAAITAGETLGARALGIGLKSLRVLGPAGAVAGFLADPGDLADEDKFEMRRWSGVLGKRFGSHWFSNQHARTWANSHLGVGDPDGRARQDLFHLFDVGGTHKVGRYDARFNKAVDKLDKAAEKIIQSLGGHSLNHPASFDPLGVGGSAANTLGSNMVLARFLTGGAGGGGGGGGGGLAHTEYVAMGITGGGSAGSSAGGGGWHAGTATYYDPRLGGINGRVGGGAWGGHPIDGSEWGCAADAKFAFGDRIEISYRGKSTVVTVMDRGGAVHGNHFDLLPGPARYLGIGSSRIRWRKVGHSSRETSRNQGHNSAGAGAQGNLSSVSSGWMAGNAGAAQETSARLHRRSGATVHIDVDGRKVDAIRHLVRT